MATFMDIVEGTRALVERNGRVSLRALELEYRLEGEELDALVEELVGVQSVARRDGDVLVWAGERSPGSSSLG